MMRIYTIVANKDMNKLFLLMIKEVKMDKCYSLYSRKVLITILYFKQKYIYKKVDL